MDEVNIQAFALINVQTGIVENSILWDGNLETWSPPDGYIAILLPPGVTMGWTYKDGEFIEPPEPEPTEEEIIASNTALLQANTQLAALQRAALTNRVNTLNDAVDLDMATEEEIAELPLRNAQLTAWKKYGVLLGRVTQQEGWALEVVWPEQPAEGIDLSVSATATRAAAS